MTAPTSRPTPSHDEERPGPGVLMVDDRPENLLAMAAVLEPLGVTLVRAGSAQAALAAIESREFAVILLDVQMPEMDGYEVARRIKAMGRLTPVIFVTALDRDRRHVHSGYESGAVDYLFKPLDPDVLRAKVQSFVRLYEARDVEARRERKRYADLSEEAVRAASEQQAARILESITDAFYALDADFCFTYVNRKAEELWGRPRAGLLGRHYWTEFPQVAGSESHRMHLRVMAERQPLRYETVSPIIGRWIAVSLYPEAGGGLSCYFQDIETRKQVEAERERLVAELEGQRTRLATVFRQAPAFLAVLRGREHVFELVNDAYYQLVGYRDLLGKPAFEAMPDARGQGFERILDEVLATGEPFVGREVPIRLQRTPGAALEERFLDFTYLPRVESDGSRSGVVAYGLDVTDHVRARHDVERARDRIHRLQLLTAALGGATTTGEVADIVVTQGIAATGAATGVATLRALDRPDELVLLRTEGIPESMSRANSRFPMTTGGPAAACMREGAPIFLESRAALLARFPDLADTWTTLGSHALATVPLSVAGETVGAMSFTFTTERAFPVEDQEFFLTLGRQAAVALERGRLFGALVQEREAALSARVEAEAAQARAEAAAQAKSQFLATMSHELRTPINAQIGYAQLLEMELAGPLTPEQREYLTRIGRSSEHLRTLIDDILDLSKIEAGALTPRFEDAWTGPVVEAALGLVRPLAMARALTLDDERPDERGVAFVGDTQRVEQVVVNLLSNAVKFTEPNGRIVVSCGTVADAPAGAELHGAGPWAIIRVADTGIGIAAEQLARVFEPFHQVDGGHTRKQGGTGLGLAISRRLARLMAGDLTAESTPGQGSTFTLWLPAVSRASARRAGTDVDGADSVEESAAVRRARAEPGVAADEAPGLAQVGDVVRASLDEIVHAYARRLRTDPAIPHAGTMRQPELEDHAVSFVGDIAQSLVIVGEQGASPGLLGDGSAIQHVIAECHGARRHAQGWNEPAVRRGHQILREELQRVVRQRFRARTAQGLAVEHRDVDSAVRVLAGLVDRAEAVSLESWRRAEAEKGRRQDAASR